MTEEIMVENPTKPVRDSISPNVPVFITGADLVIHGVALQNVHNFFTSSIGEEVDAADLAVDALWDSLGRLAE